MTGERSSKSAGSTAPTLRPEEVKAYLGAHPDFLAEHPEIVATLTPPAINGGEVRDLQQYMVVKSREELARLKQEQDALIDTSRANMTVQAQVHNAALTLLEARSFEHLIHLLTTDLARSSTSMPSPSASRRRTGPPAGPRRLVSSSWSRTASIPVSARAAKSCWPTTYRPIPRSSDPRPAWCGARPWRAFAPASEPRKACWHWVRATRRSSNPARAPSFWSSSPRCWSD